MVRAVHGNERQSLNHTATGAAFSPLPVETSSMGTMLTPPLVLEEKRGFAIPVDSPPHVCQWISQARFCPDLAQIIMEAIRASTPTLEASPHPLTPWRVFREAPPWKQLAQGLRAAATGREFSEHPCRSELFRETRHPRRNDANQRRGFALAAGRVAAHTGWCESDTAYWHALSRGCPNQLTVHGLYPEALTWERCRHTAFLLRAPGGETRDFLLNLLMTQNPRVEWLALCAEVSGELSQDAQILTDDLARRWACLAEWADREHLAYLNGLALRLTTAQQFQEWLFHAVHLLHSALATPVAMWIAPLQRGGIHLGNQGVYREVSGSFETWLNELPTPFRASEQLRRDEHGVGTVYWVPPRDVENARKWLDTITISARPWLMEHTRCMGRAQKEHQDEKLHEHLANLMRQRWFAMVAEFSAGAGHEINNPLAIISGKVQWLLGEEMEPERRLALHKILEQVSRVHRMIRDLHYVGRPPERDETTIPLETLVETALSAAGKHARGAELILEPISGSGFIRGNLTELARMLDELVRNALEAAGPCGSVRLNVGADGENVTIRISDSGPGFTASSWRHALDPFFCGRDAGRGLGMGLTVAHRIATIHGGVVTFFLGLPSRVHLVLPLAPIATPPLSTVNPMDHHAKPAR